jgi:hypothetical protein
LGCAIRTKGKARTIRTKQYRERTKKKFSVVSLGIFFFEVTDETICSGIDLTSKNEYRENPWGVNTAGA